MLSPKPKAKRSHQHGDSKAFRFSPASWTMILIIGPLILAFVFAIGHSLLFRYLDNTPVDANHFQQSLVTTTSLILASAFRLSLVGSIGLCFAQHLWLVLRLEALPLYRIEQLFTVRSKALVLTNAGVLWTAPLLFSMAVYLWLLEVAVVYPPGALTVVAQSHSSTNNLSMAVINKPVPATLDPFANGSASEFSLSSDLTPFEGGDGIFYNYNKPISSLESLSRSVMSSGRIVDLKAPRGENASYHLEFPAVRLKCSEVIQNMTNMTAPRSISTTVFSTTWNNKDNFTLFQERFLGFFIPDPTQDMVGRVSEVRTLSCEPRSALYKLNMSYVKGVQQTSFSVKDVGPFRLEGNGCFFASYPPGFVPASCNTTYLDSVTVTQNISLGEVKRMLESWNVFAPLDAMLRNMQYASSIDNVAINFAPAGDFTLPNGTTIVLREIYEEGFFTANGFTRGGDNLVAIPLHDSIFNTRRFNSTAASLEAKRLGRVASSTIPPDVAIDDFDPRKWLSITEESLNELLSYILISMLSLDLWHDMVPVTSFETRNTYIFANKLAFFLPYGLCLAVAALYVAVGIRALMRNGVPVLDGGFLQILVATRGRTEMEDLVLADMDTGTATGMESSGLSEKTLKTRVRYGKLIGFRDDGDGDAGQEKRAGKLAAFGTVHETELLTGREDTRRRDFEA